MKGLLRRTPPAKPTTLPFVNNRVQKRQHSDTAGYHLKDNKQSEVLECPNTTYTNTKDLTSKIKHKYITNIATHNVNSIRQPRKLKTLTDVMGQHKMIINGTSRNQKHRPGPHGITRIQTLQGIPGKREMKNVPQFGKGFFD